MPESHPTADFGVSTPWRQIAWNGVRFEAPQDWEVAKIGHRYLMLETENGPTLELKWQPVKGRFSHHRQLKRLATLFAKPLRKSIKPEDPPAGWESALADFESVGFSWDSGAMKGRGVVLYCRSCRTATLIQFYDGDRHSGRRHAARVLESFSDHPSGAHTRWALYDIRARIPVAFSLQSYRFRAGEFKLQFASRKERLILHRWGPASLLLDGDDLKAFVSSQAFVRNDTYGLLLREASGVCEGWMSPATMGWKRIKALLNRAPIYRRLRVWQQVDENRIMGVRMESSRRFDPGVFDDVCENYESVPG